MASEIGEESISLEIVAKGMRHQWRKKKKAKKKPKTS